MMPIHLTCQNLSNISSIKSKILIFDADAILTQSLKTYVTHAARTLRQTIQTQFYREALTKAKLERPDLIFFVSKSQSHISSFETFKAELSRHYLTKDIPLVYWSPSRKRSGKVVSLHEAKDLGSQKGPHSSFPAKIEDSTSLDPLPEDATALLQLICQEFEDKLNSLGAL